MASYVKSVQQVSITLASGVTSNTATIASVDLTKAMILYQGLTASSTSALQSVVSRVELTNATTVTATRGISNSDSVTLAAVVIEFASDVNSIQAGTITLNAVLSGTATISAVGSNAFVLWLGQSSATAGTALSRITTAVELTNSTTVTARAGTTNSNMTVGYMVVDLSSNIVNSVQKLAHNDTSNTTSYTDTIAAVTAANTILLSNGDILAGGAGGSNFEATRELTNSTTVTYTIGAATAVSKTHYTTVLEFKGAALNRAVQRGTNAMITAASKTATITAVNPNYAFCNLAGWRMTGANPSTAYPTQVLTNATTVTSALNSAGSAVTSYEVAEFIVPANFGSSAGSSTVQGAGASIAASTGLSEGASNVQGSGAASSATAGNATGASQATATGSSLTLAAGSSAGASTAPASAAPMASGAGVSTGTAFASAAGVAAANSAGTAGGSSLAQASGVAAFLAMGAALGQSSTIAIGTGLAKAIARAAGSASASGSGFAAAVTLTPADRVLPTDLHDRLLSTSARISTLTAERQTRII